MSFFEFYMSEVREREGSHIMMTHLRDDIALVFPVGSVTSAHGEPDSNLTAHFGLHSLS